MHWFLLFGFLFSGRIGHTHILLKIRSEIISTGHNGKKSKWWWKIRRRRIIRNRKCTECVWVVCCATRTRTYAYARRIISQTQSMRSSMKNWTHPEINEYKTATTKTKITVQCALCTYVYGQPFSICIINNNNMQVLLAFLHQFFRLFRLFFFAIRQRSPDFNLNECISRVYQKKAYTCFWIRRNSQRTDTHTFYSKYIFKHVPFGSKLWLFTWEFRLASSSHFIFAVLFLIFFCCFFDVHCNFFRIVLWFKIQCVRHTQMRQFSSFFSNPKIF